MTGAQVPVAPKTARRCVNKRPPIRGEAFHSGRRFARALLVGSVLTEMLARFVRLAFFKSLQQGAPAKSLCPNESQIASLHFGLRRGANEVGRVVCTSTARVGCQLRKRAEGTSSVGLGSSTVRGDDAL